MMRSLIIIFTVLTLASIAHAGANAKVGFNDLIEQSLQERANLSAQMFRKTASYRKRGTTQIDLNPPPVISITSDYKRGHQVQKVDTLRRVEREVLGL